MHRYYKTTIKYGPNPKFFKNIKQYYDGYLYDYRIMNMLDIRLKEY